MQYFKCIHRNSVWHISWSIWNRNQYQRCLNLVPQPQYSQRFSVGGIVKTIFNIFLSAIYELLSFSTINTNYFCNLNVTIIIFQGREPQKHFSSSSAFLVFVSRMNSCHHPPLGAFRCVSHSSLYAHPCELPLSTGVGTPVPQSSAQHWLLFSRVLTGF